MSARGVVRTVRALAQDDELGLEARMIALAPAADVPIRTAVRFTKWRLAGQPLPSGDANVAIRLRSWGADESNGGLRDGQVVVELLFEMFSADVDEIDETVSVAASAVAQLVDALRDYSDRTDGTIVGLAESGMAFRFGDFDGPTASGFSVTIPLIELGTE